MTFQIGDRVRMKNGAFGPVCVTKIDWPEEGYFAHQKDGVDGWIGREDDFELYAKAGWFAKGDRVVPACGGKPIVVSAVGDGPWGHHIQAGDVNFRAKDFRLATPDEIAAADAKTVEISGVSSLDQAARLASREWTKPLTSTDDKEGLAKMFHSEPDLMRKEIPAADFDFSTIKAGDRVIAELIVKRDGVDLDGDVVVERGGNDHVAFIETQYITSVVPAPKPKTLRERAIEAAEKIGFDGAYVGNMSALKAAIVDLVLAEVEKGR